MEEKILHLNYNLDFSSLSVGTDAGYSFYATENLEKTHQILVPNGVRIVEKILNSNMAIIVGVSSPRKLQVINIDTLREMCYFFFSSSIITVRVNKVILGVWTEDKIYLHTIPSLKVKHVVDRIPNNPNGIGDLCRNPESSLLVFPASETSGLIEVFDCHKLRAKFRIVAHSSPVVSTIFNNEGNLVATASEKGTIIRIFSTFRGERLYEFRRGMLRNASIYSMVFSPDNSYFAVSSNTETVHIFKIPGEGTEQQRQQPVEDQSWLYWMKSSLPTQFTEIFSEERAYASITSPFQGAFRSCLAFQNTEKSTNTEDNRSHGFRILLASFDGTIYIYRLNEEGGECPLLKQHAFIQQPVVPAKVKAVEIPASAGQGASYSPPSSVGTITESVTSYLPSVNQIPQIFSQLSYSLLQSTMNVFEKSDYEQKTDTSENEKKSSTEEDTESSVNAGTSTTTVGAAIGNVNVSDVEPPFLFGEF